MEEKDNVIIIPKLPYLERIFRTLSNGDFICSRCISETEKQDYASLKEHTQAYSDYFGQLGYKLHWNEEYGIFYLTDKSRSDQAKKSVFYNNVGDYINMVTIIQNFNDELKQGDRFITSDFIAFFSSANQNIQQRWPEVRNKEKRDRDNSANARAVDFLKFMRAKGYLDMYPEPSRTHCLLKSSYGFLLAYYEKISDRKAMLEAAEKENDTATNETEINTISNTENNSIWQD